MIARAAYELKKRKENVKDVILLCLYLIAHAPDICVCTTPPENQGFFLLDQSDFVTQISS